MCAKIYTLKEGCIKLENIIGQVLSYTGLLLYIFMYQQSDRKRLLRIQIPAVFCFAASYLLTGAVSGAVLNILALVRAIVFYYKDRYKWVRSPVVPGVFIVLSVAAVVITGYATGAGVTALDLLPMAGMIFTSISFWLNDPRYIRYVSFPSSPCWIIYLSYFAIFKDGAWGGVIAEAISMTSIIVAVIRFDILKKHKPAQTEDKSENI